ncbi:MAG: hypothetical protein ABI867_45375 [Kofleriaceae bacterium]
MKHLLIALVVLAGCGDNEAGFDPDAPQLTATGTPLTILPGGTITITLVIDNYMLVPITDDPPMPDRGHYHVFLDGNPDYIVSDAALERPIMIPETAELGAHTLEIRLVNNDHSERADRVADTIDFRIMSP